MVYGNPICVITRFLVIPISNDITLIWQLQTQQVCN